LVAIAEGHANVGTLKQQIRWDFKYCCNYVHRTSVISYNDLGIGISVALTPYNTSQLAQNISK